MFCMLYASDSEVVCLLLAFFTPIIKLLMYELPDFRFSVRIERKGKKIKKN